MAEKKTESVKIWLSEALELELRRLADQDDRKFSDYVSLVLRRHVWGNAARSVSDEEGSLRVE